MNPQEESDYKLPQVNPSTDAGAIPVQSAADPANGTQAAADDTPMDADDVDLIEKVWVEKAKSIVKDTQGNPHVQNEQMSKIKSSYMKKRYDRDVKVSE